MGLVVNVYRSDYDCELNRFHGVKRICVVNMPGPFEPSTDCPAGKLVKEGRIYKILPVDPVPDGHVGYMSGGTYAASSDSRFGEAIGGLYAAIPIHDRTETTSVYRQLTSD
jgi:hypothetical protein